MFILSILILNKYECIINYILPLSLSAFFGTKSVDHNALAFKDNTKGKN